ncbi:MAG: hypothetical protein Tsb009_25110 [Planctomycetaceae bacterium]
MNNYQSLWWQQAKSDQVVFELLRGQGVSPCHLLHYLQMITEKIAKAYFWGSGHPPPRSHAGFAQFFRSLGHTGKAKRERIARLFSFNRFVDFQNWMRAVLPIAYDLERLAPSLANNGPNPEYPWPHTQPHDAPVNFHFPIWETLRSSRGRDFMRVIKIAVNRFPEYAA